MQTVSDLNWGALVLVATLNVLAAAGWIINLWKGHFARAHEDELDSDMCVRGAHASVFVAALTFTWNPIWKWEGATENADCREHSLCLLYNWLAVTHFIAVKHSPRHFLNYAENHSAEWNVNNCHLIIWFIKHKFSTLYHCSSIRMWCFKINSVQTNFRHECTRVCTLTCMVSMWELTVLKLWKRPMLAGWGDSRGNWRKGFMSSGAGMTGGLLRKAGTGPGRFTLPVVNARTEKLDTKTEKKYRAV